MGAMAKVEDIVSCVEKLYREEDNTDYYLLEAKDCENIRQQLQRQQKIEKGKEGEMKSKKRKRVKEEGEEEEEEEEEKKKIFCEGKIIDYETYCLLSLSSSSKSI